MARPETHALDRHLAAAAETVTVKRRIGTGNTFATLTARARLSGYRPFEVVGTVQGTDSKFIMSAVPFDDVAWPGVAGGERYPRRGDWIVSQGRDRHIEQVEAVKIGDEVVRIEGRIR